jgi:hypothetical protein
MAKTSQPLLRVRDSYQTYPWNYDNNVYKIIYELHKTL